jgi:hypothetical protein
LLAYIARSAMPSKQSAKVRSQSRLPSGPCNKYPVQDLQRPLAEGIHPKMPLFQLTPAQITDLMAYLKALEPAPPSRTKGN